MDIDLHGSEGIGADMCKYIIEVASAFGCPVRFAESAPLAVLAVEGCEDDQVARVTKHCWAAGGQTLTISAQGLREQAVYTVMLQPSGLSCLSVRYLDHLSLGCTLGPSSGATGPQDMLLTQTINEQSVSATMPGAVSFKEPMAAFTPETFHALGVGGLDREITELYRRVFQSRLLDAQLLSDLGIEHVRGVLLYGPPGSGKTLMARTVSSVMKSEHVTLINTPGTTCIFKAGGSGLRLRRGSKNVGQRGAHACMFPCPPHIVALPSSLSPRLVLTFLLCSFFSSFFCWL